MGSNNSKYSFFALEEIENRLFMVSDALETAPFIWVKTLKKDRTMVF
jgi:hypothetical protein